MTTTAAQGTPNYTTGVSSLGVSGVLAPPDFGRSVNPISTKGGRFYSPNNTGTLGFSDLPTALVVINTTEAKRLSTTSSSCSTSEALKTELYLEKHCK